MPFGWGVPVVFNHGDKTAVLDRVTVVNPTPGLRVLRTYIGGPDRKYLFSGESYKWPDPKSFSDLHPVAGVQVPSAKTKGGERGVELVFALRADKPGRYDATRIAIDYHVGDTKHRVTIRSGLTVCINSRPNPRDRDCEPVDAT